MSQLGSLLLGAFLFGERRRLKDICELARTGRATAAAQIARREQSITSAGWSKIVSAVRHDDEGGDELLFLALARSSNRAEVLIALGGWLAAQRQFLRAYGCANEAHQLLPNEPAPLVLIGHIQMALGNFRAAGQAFLSAIRRDEGNPVALAGYQRALRKGALGLPPISATAGADERVMRDKIMSAPMDPQPYFALGKQYAVSSQCALALPLLEKAHALNADNSEITYWLAWTLASLGKFESALSLLDEILPQDQARPDCIRLAAECAALLGQYEHAIDLCRKFLAINTDPNASVLNTLGECLSKLERYEDAIDPLRNAVALDPMLLDARLNLAYALNYLARYQESQAQLEFLLAKERNDFGARWYRATVLLSKHEFAEGWRDYEFRFSSSVVQARTIPLPEWQGQPLLGRKVVVTAEQGIGDEIMFLSCLQDLAKQAGHCVLECNSRLVSLFSRSFPEVSVVEWRQSPVPHWLSQHADANYYIPAGSLPRWFRTTKAAFPSGAQAYLVPDADEVAAMKIRLGRLGEGIKVGIAWRGGGVTSRTRSRSLSPEQLLPLLSLPDCHFISLQYGECGEEVSNLAKVAGREISHWPEVIQNLDRYAALIAALDIVVTVCSAPVHFAGALGKQALVLAPFAPEWRYVDLEGRMIWYPNVSILRQSCLHDWAEPIAKARQSLMALPVRPSAEPCC